LISPRSIEEAKVFLVTMTHKYFVFMDTHLVSSKLLGKDQISW